MAGGGGGGFLRRLVRVHKRDDFPPMSFEADWSAISAAGLSEVFKELLADFVGVPPDPNKKKQRRLGWHFWSSADIRDIYSQKHFAEGAENGFLVRGVIYDMSALIRANNRSLSSQPLSVNPGKDLDPRKSKDWTSLIHENLNLESRVEVGKLQNVDASEVMERLGLKGVVGIEERVGISKFRTDSKKNKLEAKQALEEIIGTGDSIRAKYVERIQHKKMMAEARREQAKLGITPTAAPRLKGPGAGLQAMPGSPALVRYLEERGLNQALLAHGLEGDLETLLDQIGNYQFQVIRRIQNASNTSPTGDVLSKELLKGICSDWGLPPKQVMVVRLSGP
ncbi:hypothetical protein O6H91_01G147300 [Diphasiastrum complanatum]|uniref:Uncharacterized protein n=1 Tax=Diphasiastrum complanatum TaxID=34168 RepID=A0ACC2EX84_DIPCM|nr:hypothetical protein O6H91_01G147300 [Diphasiastrum complanatum]